MLNEKQWKQIAPHVIYRDREGKVVKMEDNKNGAWDPKVAPMREGIVEVCEEIKEVLLRKNARYGNSAAEPIGVFSKTSPLEQIAIRCDDKLKRIQNMGGLVTVIADAKDADEDTVLDLIGYLLLARAVHRKQKNAVSEQT